MIKNFFAAVFSIASFSVVACAQPQEETPEQRYERLTKDVVDSKMHARELEEKIAALRSAKEAAEQRANEWQQRSAAMEKRLQALEPEVLPPFVADDLRNNKVVLQRVYSVRTGRCFNERGEPSCLYLKLNEGSDVGFVVYKANRLFLETSKPTGLHNNYGQPLSIITRDISKSILEWEQKHGDRQIQLESY